ncbi:MAG TPA: hypothetical protein VLQ76_07390, partial [Bacteroidales bacterium]|nr:hypothetical protein [Bacteroidales bacterium]
FTTIAAILTVLLLAPATVSAQEKKTEKKITVVTVHDGEKTVTDTTIVLNDAPGGNMEEFVFETKDGRVIHGMRSPHAMPGMKGMKGMKGQKDMMIMNRMAPMPPEMEGVNYRISIDGVTVNIRAPKEKSKEADRILAEVKKILEAK